VTDRLSHKSIASPADVSLLETDVEEALRTSIRALLVDRCPNAQVTALYDGDRSIVSPLWASLARDMGLAGLLVPEALGGAGAGPREAAVVMEELGRAVAPVPYLTSAIMATAFLLRTTADDLIRALAEGQRTAAIVIPIDAHPDAPRLSIQLASDQTLSGHVANVAGVLDADLLLVPALTADGMEMRWLPADTPGVSIKPGTSFDMTRQLADVHFDSVSALALPVAPGVHGALCGALELGAAMLASEQVGIAQWCLDVTIEYLKVRRQFGEPVGGFQALKHRLADLFVAVESARAAALNAAATAARDDAESRIACAVAQSYCAQVAVQAAEEAVQMHGGIGMTWEHPVHLYLKRAKADQIALGSPGAHRASLAALVDLPAPTPARAEGGHGRDA
jgi:alkylation response protein AidB-like acyl-CoA dehydrogenase